MIDLSGTILVIERHLAEGSPQSLTYAALECRLAIERIAYDRLARAHDYISHAEIRRWQPHHVVKTIAEDVDPTVAATYTIAISRTPVGPEDDDPEAMEYVDLGTQQGFDGATLASLWNALSNVALHVRIPRSRADAVAQYGDAAVVRGKVEQCLAELGHISTGTLTSTGIGEEVSFTCECGAVVKRRAALLVDGKVVHCVNPDCDETWETERREDGEFMFGRRAVDVSCRCGLVNGIPLKTLERMRPTETLTATCACGRDTVFGWRLFHGQSPDEDADADPVAG